MRVTGIQNENNSKTSSVLKAGAIGAAAGAVARSVVPLTTEEHDFFFNSSAVQAIKSKAQKVRLNEIAKIGNEYRNGSLNVAPAAFDVFESHKDIVADEPKKALDFVKDKAEAVQDGFKTLVRRVDAVGAAKEHIEVSNIKNAAKSSRPLAYFAIAGALIAMSGQVMVNAFKSCMPKEEKPQKEPHTLTMADVLLEGLGSNTEVLFLASEAANK